EDPEFLDVNQIEDGAMILMARVQQDGFLRPKIRATVTLEDGSEGVYDWDENLLTILPRPTRARRVEYEIDPGVLYHYEQLESEGLTVLEEAVAAEYVVATGFWFATRNWRIFTPGGLEQGLAKLREVLIRDGYEQAQVTAAKVERNPETGEVDVVVRVSEGSRSMIREVRTLLELGDQEHKIEVQTLEEQPYSRVWTQDYAQTLRRDFYRRGYPDAEVAVGVRGRGNAGGLTLVDLGFTIKPGPYVEVGEIEFRGQEKTRESILRRRVDLSRGDPLNRIEVDQGRTRLARLGVFDWVDTELEPVDEATRNVIY